MARTEIPIQELAANGGYDVDVVFTAADEANDHFFLNTGREILLMKNADAGGKTATVISVPDVYGRSGTVTLTVAAGKTAAAGPFPPHLFSQTATADLGRVHVDVGAAQGANVSFAVIRTNP